MNRILNPEYERAKERSIALARHYFGEAQKAGLSPQDVLAGFLAVFVKSVDPRDPGNLALIVGAVGLMPGTNDELAAAWQRMISRRVGS